MALGRGAVAAVVVAAVDIAAAAVGGVETSVVVIVPFVAQDWQLCCSECTKGGVVDRLVKLSDSIDISTACAGLLYSWF